MKNKIIVSLLLILLVAISASAVSASEDAMDTITETSDIEITNEDSANIAIISEDPDETVQNKETDVKRLGEGVDVDDNPISVNNLKQFTDYVGTGKLYGDGTRFVLDDTYIFNLTSPQNLKKSCIIQGGTIKAENLYYFFIIDSPANGGPSSVTIKDTTFIVTKDQNIILANGKLEGMNYVLNIAGITLENITISIDNTKVDIDYAPQNNALLFVNATNPLNLTSNEINIFNNTLPGLKAIRFANTPQSNEYIENEDYYSQATEIIFAKNTKIVLNSNVIEYAVDKAVGDTPFPFQVKLIDEDGNAVVNKTISFAVDGQDLLNANTDSRGIATVLLNLSDIRTYYIYTQFIESGEYKSADMVVNTITIKKKVSKLTVKNVSYKVTATKKLYATFKDQNGKLIKNKKVTFTVNGKNYAVKTYSNGVAAVQINLNKKGTYTFTAKFAGDNIYSEVTQKGKLTVVPLATSLTTKKYTFKRYAKTKKLTTVLRSGKTVLKYQKVVFRVNGRNYVAKTNYKGIATVKIALTKKGTFKYSVKYAGTDKYNTVTRYNYVVLR